MATIIPFKAWRFTDLNQSNYQSYLAPLFDVISKSEREDLYKEPNNVVHVSVPKEVDSAKKCWKSWKGASVVKQDPNPALYIYEQSYLQNGQQFKRTGIVVLIKIKDWGEGEILRHEATMPFSVDERLHLLKETELMASPTHGLYSDPRGLLDEVILQSGRKQVVSFQTDHTREEVFVIESPEAIEKIQEFLSRQKVILADGHHRMQSSIELMKLSGKKHEGHNYHLMFLSKLEDPGLQILPTHRLFAKQANFNSINFFKKLKKHFVIKEIEKISMPTEEQCFVMLMASGVFELRLKSEFIGIVPWQFPDVVKQLTLTTLHYFVFEYSLGIQGQTQSQNRDISYERDKRYCIEQVSNGSMEMAFFCPPVAVDTVKEVCFSGSTLPQKSTYFFPKLISGLIFAGINSEDFR